MQLKVGEKVHYQPHHYKAQDRFENGIVKELRSEQPLVAWVVYNCCGEWKSYQDYTSAQTNLRDLNKGWR